MQVDDDLEAVVARPADGLEEVRQLPRDERLSIRNLERPVPDRDPDVVQAVTGAGEAVGWLIEIVDRET